MGCYPPAEETIHRQYTDAPKHKKYGKEREHVPARSRAATDGAGQKRLQERKTQQEEREFPVFPHKDEREGRGDQGVIPRLADNHKECGGGGGESRHLGEEERVRP